MQRDNVPQIRYLPPLIFDSQVTPPSNGSMQSGTLSLPCFPLERSDSVRIVPHSPGIIHLVKDPKHVELLKSLSRASSASSSKWNRCVVASQIVRSWDHNTRSDSLTKQQFKRGDLVQLRNLKQNHLNGCIGKLLHFRHRRDRWDVDIEDRMGVKSIKEDNLEYAPSDIAHKEFSSWQTSDDFGGHWFVAEVGVVLHLDKLENASKPGMPEMLKCTFSALGCARLQRIINPDAIGSWIAEVKILDERDPATNLENQESHVLDLLNSVLQLHEAANPNVIIRPHKDIAQKLNCKRGKSFWQVVRFWDSFLHARARLSGLKDAANDIIERLIEEMPDESKRKLEDLVTKFLPEGRGEIPQEISIDDLPEDLVKQVRSLQVSPELSIFQRKRIDDALPLQQLIQAESYAERLSILIAALEHEKRCIGRDQEGISLSEALERSPWEGVGLSKL